MPVLKDSKPLLTKCSTCPDELLEEEIEFVLETKPYCKRCVDDSAELSGKSLHASRLLITGYLYELTDEQQQEVYTVLSHRYTDFDRKYADLFFQKQKIDIVDNETKEVIHTVS